MKRILVVDDDTELASLVHDILTGLQYEVVTASDGTEAVEWTHRRHIDLVLMDVQMHTLSGLWFARALRNKPQTRNIPIVIMSGLADADLGEKAKEAGACGFVRKPFRSDQLFEAVRSALR